MRPREIRRLRRHGDALLANTLAPLIEVSGSTIDLTFVEQIASWPPSPKGVSAGPHNRAPTEAMLKAAEDLHHELDLLGRGRPSDRELWMAMNAAGDR